MSHGLRQTLFAITTALFASATAWSVAALLLVFIVDHGERVHRAESALLALAASAVLFIGASGHLRDSVGSASPPPPRYWLPFLAGVVWLGVLLPMRSMPFLSDDYVFLAADSGAAWEFFRPVFVAVFKALQSIAGESPLPFHAVAFSLHLGSVAFVYSAVRAAFDDQRGALLAAALFLVSPLQLEAVLWVSGLQELLWVFFSLAAIAIYARQRETSMAVAASTIAAAGLAVFSKENGAIVILLLIGVDVAVVRRPRGPNLVVYASVLVLVLAYLTARGGLERGVAPVSDVLIGSRYEAKEFLVMPYRRLVFPWNSAVLSLPSAAAGLISIAVVSGVAWTIWIGRNTRLLLAGFAVIFVTTLPLQRYLFVSPLLEHARYLYFPSIGWGMVTAAVLGSICMNRRSWHAAAVLLLAGSTLILGLNLVPWREASAFVLDLTHAVSRGTEPVSAFARWQSMHGWPAGATDRLPDSHHGVWLFRNGQDEFVRFARSGRLVGN